MNQQAKVDEKAIPTLTVGKIRKAMDGLKDDCPILLKPHNQETFTKNPAQFGTDWVNQTREVAQAYQANDDRYQQNRVLLIEVGDLSP